MSQLAIGDRVQVVDPASGKTKFEEVYLFGHKMPDVTASFVKATLVNGKVLLVSVSSDRCSVSCFAEQLTEQQHKQGCEFAFLTS
jgi:hypothetical protein